MSKFYCAIFSEAYEDCKKKRQHCGDKFQVNRVPGVLSLRKITIQRYKSAASNIGLFEHALDFAMTLTYRKTHQSIKHRHEYTTCKYEFEYQQTSTIALSKVNRKEEKDNPIANKYYIRYKQH